MQDRTIQVDPPRICGRFAHCGLQGARVRRQRVPDPDIPLPLRASAQTKSSRRDRRSPRGPLRRRRGLISKIRMDADLAAGRELDPPLRLDPVGQFRPGAAQVPLHVGARGAPGAKTGPRALRGDHAAAVDPWNLGHRLRRHISGTQSAGNDPDAHPAPSSLRDRQLRAHVAGTGNGYSPSRHSR
jgi:hypothetical protein